MILLLFLLKEVLTEFTFGIWEKINEYNSDEETYYKKTDVILNTTKDDYQNDKERLRKQARAKYRNLSQEEKNGKRKYRRNIYHNMPTENKQSLKEYQKNYREAKKSQCNQ